MADRPSDKIEKKPYNLEAEQAVLGCILMDNSKHSEIFESLKSDDFFNESHRLIFEAAFSLFSERKPPDFVMVCERLEFLGNLSKVGGNDYLYELMNIVPSVANVMNYIDIVKKDSVNRRLIAAADKLVDIVKHSDSMSTSLGNAENLIYNISKESERSTLENMATSGYYDSIIGRFQDISVDKNKHKGVLTGFKRLDVMTNGLQKSDFVVLAARPGVGKTTIGMNMVCNAAIREHKTCAVFSLEMSTEQLAQRMLCSEARVDMTKAKTGEFVQEDWTRLFAAAEKLKKAKIFVDQSSKIGPGAIMSKCRRIQAQYGLDLVMIDYLQLMEYGEAKYKGQIENRQQEISNITRSLKIMAKELNVPVLTLSQLRRIQTTAEPTLIDLRESGAIEQDADIVMFIHRPNSNAKETESSAGYVDVNESYLIIAKHRNGEVGRVRLQFIPSEVRYADYTNEVREAENEKRADISASKTSKKVGAAKQTAAEDANQTEEATAGEANDGVVGEMSSADFAAALNGLSGKADDLIVDEGDYPSAYDDENDADYSNSGDEDDN